MPKLSSEDLVWEIHYRNANKNWYYYTMTLHWKGIPVINPAVRYTNNAGTPKDELCYAGCIF